jgi:hypothetical protein
VSGFFYQSQKGDETGDTNSLADLLSQIDTTNLPDTIKKILAPVDSALMWNKLRYTPGGEELYQGSPSPIMPFLRGLKDWWSDFLTTGKDTLPTELKNPGSSLLGRYSIHIPYVPKEGLQSPQGVQLQHSAPTLDWLQKNITGVAPPPGTTGYQRPLYDRGSLELIAGGQPAPDLESSIRHERTHATINSSMTPLMQERYLPQLEDQFPQGAAWIRGGQAYSGASPRTVGHEMLAYANEQPSDDRSPMAQATLDSPVGRLMYRRFNENLNPRTFRKPGEFTWSDVNPWSD